MENEKKNSGSNCVPCKNERSNKREKKKKSTKKIPLLCRDRKFGRHFIWILQLNANEHSCFYHSAVRSHRIHLVSVRSSVLAAAAAAVATLNLFTLSEDKSERTRHYSDSKCVWVWCVCRLNLLYRRHTRSPTTSIRSLARSLTLNQFRRSFSDFFSSHFAWPRFVMPFCWILCKRARSRTLLCSHKVFSIFIHRCFCFFGFSSSSHSPCSVFVVAVCFVWRNIITLAQLNAHKMLSNAETCKWYARCAFAIRFGGMKKYSIPKLT